MTLPQQLQEAWQSLVDQLAEPCSQDEAWLPLSAPDRFARGAAHWTTPAQHAALRQECRALAVHNEFAVNGHENRISYIVGAGHQYRVVPRRGEQPNATVITAAQCEIDDFLQENQWPLRQQEIVRRRDRDGEVFLRLFVSPAGRLLIRFVDPGLVAAPAAQSFRPAASWGILTLPDDVESVQGYYIADELVPAAQIQHRKANVDADVKRGLPLYTPVRKDLHRAEKLLRNMTAVAEIQSAIALIRKHRQAARGGLEALAANGAQTVVTAEGQTAHVRRYAPGTILDAPANIEYEFPAAQLDAGSFVTVLQAELRAIASRLVMPEFMLSSDASNANYSSTLVAEGPAMRMFARLQGELITEDLVIMRRVLETAAAAGRISHADCHRLEVVATPPSLALRQQLQEAQRFRIEQAAGILSPQTWCQRVGLDYDQEMQNLARHRRSFGGAPQ